METKFDAEKHEYRIGGRIVPSVTQVIQGVFGSSPWWSDFHAEVGTALHLACAYINQGMELEQDSVDDAIAGRLAGYRKFLNDIKPKIIISERQLYSAKKQFAGTIDILFQDGIKYVLADIKSSYHPTARIQLGGYNVLLAEHNRRVERAMVIELHKSGDYQLHHLNSRELTLAGNQFLAALTIYNFKTANNIKD
jgi:hypothetical protein